MIFEHKLRLKLTELNHSEQIRKYTHLCLCRSQYQRQNAAEDVERPHDPANRNINILRYSNLKVHLWSNHKNKHYLFVLKTLQWHCPGYYSSCDHRDKGGNTLRFPCHLVSRQAGVRGSGKQNSAHSETQQFMTVTGHFQATVVLIPGKELWNPLYRRLCGSQKRAGHGEGKIPCPLSVPSNYSPSLSILNWYEILECYNVIYSAAPLSRMHTHIQNVQRGVQNFRFFMHGYIWVKNTTLILRRIINRYAATRILTYVGLYSCNRKF